MGVGLRFMWGDQRVGEFFMAPGKKQSFRVGSAAGAMVWKRARPPGITPLCCA